MARRRTCQVCKWKSMAEVHVNQRLKVTLGPFNLKASCWAHNPNTSSQCSGVPTWGSLRSRHKRPYRAWKRGWELLALAK
eukprot:7132468-Lingulodinium_polyedra.AAC.1